MIPEEAYNAGKLLDELRPGVEEVLQELAKCWPDVIPTCPSQSLRARRAVEALNAVLSLSREEKAKDMRQKQKLREFLAVHETVTLMESRWRESQSK